MPVDLVIGQGNSLLARLYAQKLNVQFLPFKQVYFADTESWIELDASISIDKHVFFVYQFDNKTAASINDQMVGVLQGVSLINQAGARKIDLCMPYIPYSRQSHSECYNYKGSIYTLCQCFRACGVSALYTVDIHDTTITVDASLPVYSIAADYWWADVIKREIISKHPMEKFCIVSPDEGGCHRAQAVAQHLNLSFAYICKKRIERNRAVSYNLIGDVQGYVAIVLDDIIDTAHTAVGASALLNAGGAAHIYGCFTHAVLSRGSVERLAGSGYTKIFLSDTFLSTVTHTKISSVSIYNHIVLSIEHRSAQTEITF